MGKESPSDQHIQNLQINSILLYIELTKQLANKGTVFEKELGRWGFKEQEVSRIMGILLNVIFSRGDTNFHCL